MIARLGGVSGAALILLIAGLVSPAAAAEGGTTAPLDGEAPKSPPGEESKAPSLVEMAQEKMKEWEPRISKLTRRFTKEYTEYNQWDYDALSIEGLDAPTLLERLREKGEEGWECFESVQLTDGRHLLFRRRRMGAATALPFREIIEFIILRLLSSEGA